jgi:hypothetical protein
VHTGQKGVVLGKVDGFVKVKWDGHDKPSFILASELLPKSNPPRQRYVFANPKGTAAVKSPRGSGKPNPQTKFSQATLAHLRKQFAAIDGADVVKARAQFDKIFAGTSRPLLKQLAEAQPKIEWVSQLAKNTLVARRNPTGKKKNLHPLEIGANAAMILGGLDHLWTMMKRGQKKRPAKRNSSSSGGSAVTSSSSSPRVSKGSKKALPNGRASARKKNLGLIGLVENLQAADYLRKKLKKKNSGGKSAARADRTPAVPGKKQSVTSRRAKSNPNDGRIFKEFTGSESTKITHGYFVPEDEPTNIDELGQLTEVILASGKVLRFPREVVHKGKTRLVFDRSPQIIRGETSSPLRRGESIHFLPNPIMLNGKELPSRRRRFVVAQREPFFLPKDAQKNRRHNYGKVVQVTYLQRKPHLYDGDEKVYPHYHNLGEEGGREPQFVLHNGTFRFVGGDYKIHREGIRD